MKTGVQGAPKKNCPENNDSNQKHTMLYSSAWTRLLKKQTKISRLSQKNEPKMNFSGKMIFLRLCCAAPEYDVGVHKVRSDVRFGRIVRSHQIDKCQAVYESGRAEFSAIHTVDKRGVWCLTWNLSGSYARVQIDKCQTCVRVAIHTAFCHMYCW